MAAVLQPADAQLSQTIPRTPPKLAAENALTLRNLGLGHIRKLAGAVWTDHNVHDPGITSLDVLCFALTDLAYRCAWPVEDLLASEEIPSPAAQFFTAREVLTQGPVTASDYRKLLIDIEGVNNAWFERSEAERVYLDSDARELTVAPNSSLRGAEPIILNGLYDVRVELAEDAELGDLNDPRVLHVIAADDTHDALELIVTFDRWSLSPVDFAEDWSVLEPAFDLVSAAELGPRSVEWDLVDLLVDPVVLSVSFELRDDRLRGLLSCRVKNGNELAAFFDVESSRINVDLASHETRLRAALDAERLRQILLDYSQRIGARRSIMRAVKNRLSAHRNLCEDVATLGGLSIEEIGICAQIEVEPLANVEEILAIVRDEIERFLSPEIRFRTLEEMLDPNVEPKLGADEAFRGPRLEHGFLSDQDLAAPTSRQELYASDLINIMMDVPGVVAVKSLIMANHIDGIEQTRDAKWVLPLNPEGGRVPRLAMSKSEFLFFKGVLPIAVNRNESDALLAEIKARRRSTKLGNVNHDIEVPSGRFRAPDTYTSIQELFAQTYGIGTVGLDSNASQRRRGQARQFKAYLTLFDQLFADYLAQLAHVGDLLSVRQDALECARFTQPIYGTPGLAPLLRAFVGENPTLAFDRARALEEPWALFVANEANEYAKGIKSIIEDEKAYERRRNEILDHLLARFAEQFIDYAALVLDRFNEGQFLGLRDPYALIQTKTAFLLRYAEVGYERATGLDLNEDELELFSTSNLTGLETRVALLLGIEPKAAPLDARFRLEVVPREEDKWDFEIIDGDGEIVVASVAALPSREALGDRLRLIGRLGRIRDRWTKDDDGSGELALQLIDDSDIPVARGSRGQHGDEALDEIIAAAVDWMSNLSRSLAAPWEEQYRDEVSGEWRWRIRLPGGLIGLESVASYPTRPELGAAIRRVSELGQDVARYEVAASGPQWLLELLETDDTAVGRSPLLATRAEALSVRDRLVAFITDEAARREGEDLDVLDENYTGDLRTGEGFHVIEHIALRPARSGAGAPTMKIDIDPECALEAHHDPYSFRATLVFPAWPTRFRDVMFRAYVERIVRLEAPAHVALKICWVNQRDMDRLEQALLPWLESQNHELPTADAAALLQNLIDALSALRSVYPEATLHDCKGPISETPVVLDNTALGDYSEYAPR